MKVYYIRHGIAEDYGTDEERGLTTLGRIQLNETFEKFKTEFESEDFVVYSSPLKRAVQTSEILSDKLNTMFEIKQSLIGFGWDDIIEDLKDKHDVYILISHEPSISWNIKKLTGERVIVSRGSIHLLDFEDGLNSKAKYKMIK